MFEVLHSSAGAGKTHTLVKYYLQRCLGDEDPSAYGRVLALTFTNKAAGEMRERVLEYLAGLAEGGDPGAQLADVRDHLKATLGLTDAQVAQRAAATQRHILHHWPRFAVSTIDAFTKRLITPFARDLRLDSDLRMTTEEPLYRARAVDLLLEDAGRDTALTDILTATCEHLLDEERPWRPDLVLLGLSEQLGRENALVHLQRLKAMPTAAFLSLHKELGRRNEQFKQRIRRPAIAALEAIEQAGIRPDEFAQGSKGIHSFLRKLARFEGHVDLNSFAQKSFEKDAWAKKGVGAATEAAIEHVAPLLREAMQVYHDATPQMPQHTMLMAIWRDLLPTATMHELDTRLARLKTEDGVAFFSDLTRLVAETVQEEPAPFLFERLGERYDHLMVDEFQDTSVLQWRVLLPLVENALSKGGSTLLVGDAKQAIYRWRNGEARQFVDLPNLFDKASLVDGDLRERVLTSAYHAPPPLIGNYRSGAEVIAFNNALFGVLAGTLGVEEQRVYSGHAQEARRALAGFVELECLEKDAPEEGPSPVETYVRERVEESLRDGFRPCDIAVLVRTKAQGAKVAGVLVGAGHKVVSPDGLALGMDPGVNASVAMISWLHRRADEDAAHAVQYMALRQAGDTLARPFDDGRRAPEILQELVRTDPSLSPRAPLGHLLLRVFACLGISPADDAFAMGLQQEVHDHTTANGDDLAGFLEHWQRTGRNRTAPTSAGPEAVRIMTVHKSKGLQFPVVIVPWTDMTARAVGGERIWIDPREAAPELPSALVQLNAALTGLGIPEVDTEQAQQQLDAMNLLYVAFTRPEQRLYAAVPAVGNALVVSKLRERHELVPGGRWSVGERAPASRSERTEDHGLHLRPAAPRTDQVLAIRHEAPLEWSAADPDPFRSRGNTMHAILARVNTPADLPTAIAEQGAAEGLGAQEQADFSTELARVLALPGMERFFRADLVALSEATLITADGRALRPDRIVYDQGTARVLDIKTGARRAEHDQQVLAYAALLRDLGETHVTAHLLYLPEGLLIDVDA